MNRNGDTRLARAKDEAKRWAMVVLLVLVLVVGYYVSRLSTSVDHIDGAVARIERSSTKTEAAASELVAFVHEVQAQTPCGTTTTSTTAPCQPTAGSQGQSQVVTMLVDLLCASSDPVRQQACADLTHPGG